MKTLVCKYERWRVLPAVSSVIQSGSTLKRWCASVLLNKWRKADYSGFIAKKYKSCRTNRFLYSKIKKLENEKVLTKHQKTTWQKFYSVLQSRCWRPHPTGSNDPLKAGFLLLCDGSFSISGLWLVETICPTAIPNVLICLQLIFLHELQGLALMWSTF